ncbi:MAG: serine/threonine protein kinase [Myxococcales bacterium]|nr:serine/threonine protein kinase [Myxococcales bacterium]
MAGSERLGDCDVLFELASGGMATVLLARQLGDAGFERLVALKRVHRHLVEDPEVFAMASDEARLAALVRHTNVVAVTGVLDTGGELVLVQDYVEGFGLARLLRELGKAGERLEPAIAARILIDAARGLHATHEAKDLLGQPLEIVHRDVSPQNLLVGSDGTTRLIDFGIARAERRMSATRTGVLKGKLSYMAPEQIGEERVDRRADVFAAGAVLFEALTGKRAFDGQDDASVMAKVLTTPPDTSLVDAACPELAPVVRRALARAPEERFATAAELAKAIGSAVKPADDEDVKELVERVFGAELTRLRERIAAAIAHVSASGSDDGDDGGGRTGEAAETPLSAVDDPAPPARPPRAFAWPALAGLGAAGALLLLLVASRGTDTAAGASANTSAPDRSATASPSPTIGASAAPLLSPRLEPSAPSATESASPSGSARPPPPPRRSAPSAATSTPSARPDLHPSPYASAPR